MKEKRFVCVLLAVFVAFGVSGCSLYTAGNAKVNLPAVNSGVYPSTFAHSFVGDVDIYVPGELQEQMDEFGKSQYILQADAVVSVYTEIPKPEHDAKGTAPISIVMPDLDLTKYSTPYMWRDEATDLEVHAYYRMIAGVLTDELVKVYVDHSGNIVQYETVNLDKYDSLHIDEKQVESMRISLNGQVRSAVNDWILECYAPVAHPASSAYLLFTDTQGRIVLCTRAALNTDREIRQMVTDVDLYAIVDP